uniref:Uncharacterized protein n=1 Tax=Rhizophora mucronata TaxID=61149 RepID=A0A2P2N928_RHIMU
MISRAVKGNTIHNIFLTTSNFHSHLHSHK